MRAFRRGGTVVIAGVLAFSTGPLGLAEANQTVAPTADPRDVVARTDRVTVRGEGRVPVRPDVMYLRAGVEVRGKTPGQAYRAAAASAKRLVAVLRQAGVAPKDIQTAELSVQPEHDREDHQQIVGYRATEDVNANVRDLSKADATLDAVAKAGDDVRLHSISFNREDFSRELKKARKLAFKDAKRKAEQYAKMAGRKLGRLISANESAVSPIPPHIITPKAIAAEGGHVSTGEGVMRVDAELVYALD